MFDRLTSWNRGSSVILRRITVAEAIVGIDRRVSAWWDEQNARREKLTEEAREEFDQGTWKWGFSDNIQVHNITSPFGEQ